jgi:hypothetical protein
VNQVIVEASVKVDVADLVKLPAPQLEAVMAGLAAVLAATQSAAPTPGREGT